MAAVPAARRRHARNLLVLALLVAAVHAIVVSEFGERLRSFAPGGARWQPMEVAFVRELEVTPEPPAAAPPPVGQAFEPTPPAVSRAASAPEEGQPAVRKPRRPRLPPPIDDTPAPSQASSPLTARAIDEGEVAVPSIADASPTADDPIVRQPAPAAAASAPPPVAAASSPPIATASAASAVMGTGFDWPRSTQLRYALSGNFRGEVEGSAMVQWVRIGPRYEVRLEVAVGPSFAPLMSRQMVSQGELGDGGLVPRIYEERTRIGFSARQFAMTFTDGRAVLANGTAVAAPRGLQDASSQFVQMSYLFTRNPSLLQAGQTLSMPVALPRRVDTWVYEVVGEEMLATPLGELKTFHLRPRRESPRAGELVAQAWYAPAVQYLPVRILIHQDADSFVDLRLESPPLQSQ